MEKKSNYQVALDVIAGKYGNNSERYNRLTAEGYDYTAIQSIVNAVIYDGYKEETPKYLEIEVNLDVYSGINLKFTGGKNNREL